MISSTTANYVNLDIFYKDENGVNQRFYEFVASCFVLIHNEVLKVFYRYNLDGLEYEFNLGNITNVSIDDKKIYMKMELQ